MGNSLAGFLYDLGLGDGSGGPLKVLIAFLVIFFVKVVPFAIALYSLVKLLLIARAGYNDYLNRSLPYLIVIIAAVTMLVEYRFVVFGLPAVCIAMIVMTKLRPDKNPE